MVFICQCFGILWGFDDAWRPAVPSSRGAGTPLGVVVVSEGSAAHKRGRTRLETFTLSRTESRVWISSSLSSIVAIVLAYTPGLTILAKIRINSVQFAQQCPPSVG